MGMDPVTEPSEALGSPVPPPPPTVLEPLIGYPLRTGSAVTLEQRLPISTDGEACQALEAAFQDFMEEVHSFWDRPASAPSVLKQVAPLVSLEGSDKLGLVGFPPVDHHCGLGQGSASGGLTQGPCVPEPAMQGHGDAPEAGLCSGSTGDQPREYGEYPDRLYGWHTMGSPTP
ncbi:UNVERIFIED_CONTAM: hypothetical protein FKN15_042540 [Acipenser sinensis]